MMFAATGALEEAVGGNSWEDEVEARIFAPLNMSMSSPTMSRLRPDQKAAFANCYAGSGGARDLDRSEVIDCTATSTLFWTTPHVFIRLCATPVRAVCYTLLCARSCRRLIGGCNPTL